MEGVGGQALVHGGRGWGGGARGPYPPPIENEKKKLSEEILTSFTYVLLMKLGGNRYTIHAKWKGWADKCVSMVVGGGALPHPPLEI